MAFCWLYLHWTVAKTPTTQKPIRYENYLPDVICFLQSVLSNHTSIICQMWL